MKNTYTYQEVNRSYWTGFSVAATCLLVAMLTVWVAGCGDATIDPERTDLPVVSITCDKGCIILAHNTLDIEAYYYDTLEWYDSNTDITRRLTYVDDPPADFTIVACNDNGCVEVKRDEFAQNDPIGCDPEWPCPTEVEA